MLDRLFDPLLSLIYPQSCSNCGSTVDSIADGPVCSLCWASSGIFSDAHLFCSKCGEPAPSQTTPDVACGQCSDFHFDLARAAGIYESALRAVVLRLKTEPHLPKTARGHLLNAFDRLELSQNVVIVPVPISRARRVERGFNQAEVIAAAISGYSGLAMDSRSLVRKSHTPVHRAAMDRKAREATVKNAFEVVRRNLVAGRDILLVDDLYTSGATASNCAKTLKKNGAGRVIVLTLARAVQNLPIKA